MYITVLCKVVDNFGDIGVVWRLCRQLFYIQTKYKINLVVDDLVSFSKINTLIDVNKSFQNVDGIDIYSWNDEDICHDSFYANDGEKLSVILECFQCGRPDWMEKILFEEKLSRTVNIIMIDYLTAEKYAEDFHCLKSLTRSSKVQKVNFMPGFTNKTGGLIIDDAWKEIPVINEKGNILVFTYEKEWSCLTSSLNNFLNMKENEGKKILLAQGRGKDSFLEAWEKVCYTKENKIEELPYMNQNEWDDMMKNCSVLIIRGEESMSRACLSGIPFLWHAYPQSNEYQIVKVEALLNRLSVYFNVDDFKIIENAWRILNNPIDSNNVKNAEKYFTEFLFNSSKLVYGFEKFACDLRKNGDLAANLMTFICKIDIIK